MVGSDGVHDLLGLAILLGKFSAYKSVGPFHLVIHCFADVVQKADPLGILDVESQFARHAAANESYFDGMVQDVLSVAGPVFEFTHEPDELRVDAVNADIKSSFLALFLYGHLHLP